MIEVMSKVRGYLTHLVNNEFGFDNYSTRSILASDLSKEEFIIIPINKKTKRGDYFQVATDRWIGVCGFYFPKRIKSKTLTIVGRGRNIRKYFIQDYQGYWLMDDPFVLTPNTTCEILLDGKIREKIVFIGYIFERKGLTISDY